MNSSAEQFAFSKTNRITKENCEKAQNRLINY